MAASFSHDVGRRIRQLLQLSVVSLLMCAAGFSAAYGQGAERIAFDAALRAFESGLWERAVTEFAEFAGKFPKSPLLADAEQRRVFAQAESDFMRADYPAAAAGFAAYQQAHPSAPRAVLAGVREAEAALQKPDLAAALAALTQADRPFAKALAEGTQPSVLLRGLVVKADALLASKEVAAAETALLEAEKFAQSPEERWTRLRRLARLRDGAGNTGAAVEAANQLLNLVNVDPALAGRRAETVSYVGQLLLRAGQAASAATTFIQNLAPEVPLEFRREATLQLAELDLSRGDAVSARQRLETFLGAQPADPAAAALRLRLGQVLFRQYLAQRPLTNNSPEVSALLAQAAGNFAIALTNNPAADLVGPLHLGNGWCLWEEALTLNNPGRMGAAETNFLAATATLLPGADQSVARFKYADCLAFRKEWAAAATNYLRVAREAETSADTKSLAEPALQQAVIAATEAGDTATAQSAMARLLELNPHGEPAARSALLVGQSLSLHGRDDEATELLRGYVKRFPDSSLRADVQLALIASQLRSGEWTNALVGLDGWISTHTNHPSLPRAEFDRWWAGVNGGRVTNAAEQVVALAARYPGNTNLLTAQLWLADSFFSEGDFARAEQACVNVVTNSAWRGTVAWCRAKLLAAESARRRQAWSNATNHIFELLNSPALPEALEPSAYFALGELWLELPALPGSAPLTGVSEALDAFKAAGRLTNSPVAPAALGKMADCHLQLATQRTNSYALALELYQRVVDWPTADVATRSKAAMGLGIVKEKLAANRSPSERGQLLKEALGHYVDVAHGKLLRPAETADAWWLKEAGREAGRLLEQQRQWREAAALYEQLARELPALKPAWEARAAEARRRAGAG